jgi:hypothetical protein
MIKNFRRHIPTCFCALLTSWLMLAAVPAFSVEDDAPLSLPASASEILDLAEASWNKGAFKLASRQTAALLLDDSRLSQSELIRLYLLKARLEISFGHEEDVRFWLEKVARINTKVVLDPVKDPPVLHQQWSEVSAARSTTPQNTLQDKTRPRPVILAVLPFGLGHFDAGRVKDGFLFLSLSLLNVSASREFTGISAAGIWGWELLSIMPDLYSRNRPVAENVYKGLSFAPFGAAQFKNGDTVKGMVLGTFQVLTLTAATITTDRRQRNNALGALGISWIYGSIDSWAGHRAWTAPKITGGPQHQFFALTPVVNEGDVGMAGKFSLIF